MSIYLSGSTHYLTKKQAEALYPAGEYSEHRLESDGTYSVFHLVSKPVQHGQVEWKKNNKND